MTSRPCRRVSTSPAARSRRRCQDTSGWDRSTWCIRSVTVPAPSASRWIMRRAGRLGLPLRGLFALRLRRLLPLPLPGGHSRARHPPFAADLEPLALLAHPLQQGALADPAHHRAVRLAPQVLALVRGHHQVIPVAFGRRSRGRKNPPLHRGFPTLALHRTGLDGGSGRQAHEGRARGIAMQIVVSVTGIAIMIAAAWLITWYKKVEGRRPPSRPKTPDADLAGGEA